MDLWLKVFEVMLPVILVVSVGFLFGKFTSTNMKPVNLILLYLATPCLIFTSLIGDNIKLNEILNIVYIGGIIVLIGVPIIYLVLRTINKDPKVFLNTIIFPNTANLGLPIVLFAFGVQIHRKGDVKINEYLSKCHFGPSSSHHPSSY